MLVYHTWSVNAIVITSFYIEPIPALDVHPVSEE